MRGTSLGSTFYRPQVTACSTGRERGGSPVGSLVPPLPDARRCPLPSVAATVVAKETPIRGQSRTPGRWYSSGPLRTCPGWPRPSLGPAPSLLHPPPLSPRWPPLSRPLPLSYNLLDGETTLPAIVFLHGLFGSKTNFNSIAKAMVQRTGRRVSFRVGRGRGGRGLRGKSEGRVDLASTSQVWTQADKWENFSAL